jgi:hypothetical protein
VIDFWDVDPVDMSSVVLREPDPIKNVLPEKEKRRTRRVICVEKRISKMSWLH